VLPPEVPLLPRAARFGASQSGPPQDKNARPDPPRNGRAGRWARAWIASARRYSAMASRRMLQRRFTSPIDRTTFATCAAHAVHSTARARPRAAGLDPLPRAERARSDTLCGRNHGSGCSCPGEAPDTEHSAPRGSAGRTAPRARRAPPRRARALLGSARARGAAPRGSPAVRARAESAWLRPAPDASGAGLGVGRAGVGWGWGDLAGRDVAVVVGKRKAERVERLLRARERLLGPPHALLQARRRVKRH